eukprot:COSAG01_NODE_2277_length_8010_cov_15.062571_5_plen_93_part_00
MLLYTVITNTPLLYAAYYTLYYPSPPHYSKLEVGCSEYVQKREIEEAEERALLAQQAREAGAGSGCAKRARHAYVANRHTQLGCHLPFSRLY